VYFGIALNKQIFVFWIQEGLYHDKGVESLFKKIITESFPNTERDRKVKDHQSDLTQPCLHVIPLKIRISNVNVKEVIKTAREKESNNIYGSPNYSDSRLLNTSLNRPGNFQILNEQNCQPKKPIIPPQKKSLSFNNEGEMNIFPDKQKMRKYLHQTVPQKKC
jgi:hypothetical protein